MSRGFFNSCKFLKKVRFSLHCSRWTRPLSYTTKILTVVFWCDIYRTKYNVSYKPSQRSKLYITVKDVPFETFRNKIIEFLKHWHILSLPLQQIVRITVTTNQLIVIIMRAHTAQYRHLEVFTSTRIHRFDSLLQRPAKRNGDFANDKVSTATLLDLSGQLQSEAQISTSRQIRSINDTKKEFERC